MAYIVTQTDCIMADDTIVQPKRGRPHGTIRAEPHARVSTWVDVKHYNQLVKLANHRDQSVSALVRDLLKLKVR